MIVMLKTFLIQNGHTNFLTVHKACLKPRLILCHFLSHKSSLCVGETIVECSVYNVW